MNTQRLILISKFAVLNSIRCTSDNVYKTEVTLGMLFLK